jgi:hypothetical protein
MKRYLSLAAPLRLLLLLTALTVASGTAARISPSDLPRTIDVTATQAGSHVQGVAVDAGRGYAYFSFTTELIKTDLQGNILASLTGMTCHMGCIDLDPATGKLYASVEYKNDNIGRGIMDNLGKKLDQRENCFYIGIIDTRKLNRTGMDAQTSGVMKTVYLPEVRAFYEDSVSNNGRRFAHRYGCSGIDGISLGPQFGRTGGKTVLNVDVAVYGDKERTDNDHQLLLQYDPATIEKYALPLDEARPHHSGPGHAAARYYVYTGNTEYGIQNLEYDAYTHYWLMAVYKGRKSAFPNYTLFAVDGTLKPRRQWLKGVSPREKGKMLTLAADGLTDSVTGLRGWRFPLGSTGLESLGNGYYYISKNGKDKNGRQYCHLQLYRWNGRADGPFEAVK